MSASGIMSTCCMAQRALQHVKKHIQARCLYVGQTVDCQLAEQQHSSCLTVLQHAPSVLLSTCRPLLMRLGSPSWRLAPRTPQMWSRHS